MLASSGSIIRGRGRGRGLLSSVLESRSESGSRVSPSVGEPGKSIASVSEGLEPQPGTSLSLSDLPPVEASGVASPPVPSPSPDESLVQDLSDLSLSLPENRTGSSGTTLPCMVNYLSLSVEQNVGIFHYEVAFDPQIDSRNERFRCVGQISPTIGQVKNFDGVKLFLPKQLPEKVSNFINLNILISITLLVLLLGFSLHGQDFKWR